MLTGYAVRGRSLVQHMQQRVAAIRRGVGAEPPVRVFVDNGFFYTIDPAGPAGDLITMAGGVDVAADAEPGKPYPLAKLRAAKPQAYLAVAGRGTTLVRPADERRDQAPAGGAVGQVPPDRRQRAHRHRPAGGCDAAPDRPCAPPIGDAELDGVRRGPPGRLRHARRARRPVRAAARVASAPHRRRGRAGRRRARLPRRDGLLLGGVPGRRRRREPRGAQGGVRPDHPFRARDRGRRGRRRRGCSPTRSPSAPFRMPRRCSRGLELAGVPVAVVSNWDYSLRRTLAGLGLEFDAIVTCGETGVRKPDPAHLPRGARAAGRRTGGALHIGDRDGTDGVGAAGGRHRRADRRSHRGGPLAGIPSPPLTDVLGLL